MGSLTFKKKSNPTPQQKVLVHVFIGIFACEFPNLCTSACTIVPPCGFSAILCGQFVCMCVCVQVCVLWLPWIPKVEPKDRICSSLAFIGGEAERLYSQ